MNREEPFVRTRGPRLAHGAASVRYVFIVACALLVVGALYSGLARPKPALASALVTKSELLELADWERKHADATKKASAAEKELKFRRQQLVEKVLGLKTADELKCLAPEKLVKLQDRRRDQGDWKLERGAPEFFFVKKSEGRYPAWKQFFVDEMGETAAARIQAETDPSYSYGVEVSL